MVHHPQCINSNASFSVHQLLCIIPPALPLVHHLRCIIPGASTPMHHSLCINFGASPLVHHPQCITPVVSFSVHHSRCFTSSPSPPGPIKCFRAPSHQILAKCAPQKARNRDKAEFATKVRKSTINQNLECCCRK